MPFKASAWQASSDVADEVVRTGVANTLLLGPVGPTNAFNTDFSGFKWAYRRRFADAPPGTIALLGAGGVGTATAAALVDLGATAIRIYDVLADRSHALAEALRRRNSMLRVDVAASAEDAVDGVDGVVNGTPVGMYFQPGAPVELAAIGEQRWVFDAIYSPIETELMARAAEMKLARITGFDLFIGPGHRCVRDLHRAPSPARRPRRTRGPDACARSGAQALRRRPIFARLTGNQASWCAVVRCHACGR